MKYMCTFDNGEINYSADVERFKLTRCGAGYMFFNLMIERGLIKVEPNQKNKTYNESFRKHLVINKYDKDGVVLSKDSPRKKFQVSSKRFTYKQYNLVERNPFYKIKDA